jgi:hypothetical protein
MLKYGKNNLFPIYGSFSYNVKHLILQLPVLLFGFWAYGYIAKIAIEGNDGQLRNNLSASTKMYL